jgi:hypothetical protein
MAERMASSDALAQAERVTAERLIRSMAETLSQGAPVKDLDGLVQRNAGRVSLADIRSGRVGSNVLGDIISTVEQAKGNTNFNLHAATPEQMKAYLMANGFDPSKFSDFGGSPTRAADAGASGDAKGKSDSTYTGDLGSLKAEHYPNSPFAKAGLSWQQFDSMRREGFNADQIISAVKTNKSLGLDANSNPAATARLQRDVPSAIPGLHTTHGNWKHVHEVEKAEKDARARGDTNEADRLKKEGEQGRKHAEEHDRSEQERVRKEKPERVQDLIDKQEEIKRAVEGHAAKLNHGNEAATKETLEAIEAYRRDPARKNYKPLKEIAGNDPAKKEAFGAIDRGLAEDAKLKSTVDKLQGRQAKHNEQRVEANKVTDKENEDILAALGGDPAPATTKAEASEPAKKANDGSVKTADNDHPAVKAATRPEKVKTAAAKPAAPTV